MSSEKVVQRISPASTGTPNFYTLNPSDPKTPSNHSDRQGQDDEEANRQARQRIDCRDKARRKIVGKEEDEELYEQKYHKRLSWTKNEARRHVAEFLGTFFLIFFVCGIQVNQGMYPNGGVANIDKGLVSGFVVIGLIFSFGSISGAHFNPCVTLAFVLRGTFNFWRFLTYMVFQFAGAVSAAAVLYGLFGIVDELGTTTPGEGVKNTHAFGVEIILTFLLITVILTTAENAHTLGPAAGMGVGLTFGAIEVWGWNFTGASVNPWRTIAPTMIADYAWKTYWIYIIGPLVGTVFAVLVQRFMVAGNPREEEKDAGKVTGKHDDRND